MGLYDPVRDLVANDRWCAECPVCKRTLLKRDMYGLLARRGSWTTPKILLYLCEDCFFGFCEAVKANPWTVADKAGIQVHELAIKLNDEPI